MSSIGSINTTSGAGASESDWSREASDKVLDLRTPISEVFDFFDKSVNDGSSSEARTVKLQTLLSMRSQRVTALSNLLRTMFDTMSQIIRNIRA